MISTLARAAALALALGLTGCHPATLRLHVLGIDLSIVVQPQSSVMGL
ncbi:MAG TPA: hypothetical protein VGG89_06210 [Candidatus Baltobacteraceae bacterium]|jgi:hypothetical protein